MMPQSMFPKHLSQSLKQEPVPLPQTNQNHSGETVSFLDTVTRKLLGRQHQFSAGHSGCLPQQDDLRMRASCDQHCPWTQTDCRLPDQSPFSRLSVWDRVSLYSQGEPQTCDPLRWPCPSCLSAMVKWRLQRDLSHGTLNVFICWQRRAAKPSK